MAILVTSLSFTTLLSFCSFGCSALCLFNTQRRTWYERDIRTMIVVPLRSTIELYIFSATAWGINLMAGTVIAMMAITMNMPYSFLVFILLL